MLGMKEGLICFSCDNKQTLVFHGSVDLTITREVVNDIKLELLNRINQTQKSNSATQSLFPRQ